MSEGFPVVQLMNNVLYVTIPGEVDGFVIDQNSKKKEFSQGLWSVVLKEDGNVVVVTKREKMYSFLDNKEKTTTWEFVISKVDDFVLETVQLKELNTPGYGLYGIVFSVVFLSWLFVNKEKE